jgi:hypothetical protein
LHHPVSGCITPSAVANPDGGYNKKIKNNEKNFFTKQYSPIKIIRA